MRERTSDEQALIAAATAMLRSESEETTREDEQARYEAEIAASAQRLAEDPVAQARVAAARQQEETAFRQRLKDLKALAKLTSPPDPRPALPVQPGWTLIDPRSSQFNCAECHLPIWGEVARVGIRSICTPCEARHLLKCDQCGRHDDLIAQKCTDGRFRCDDCMVNIVPAPRQVAVGMGTGW